MGPLNEGPYVSSSSIYAQHREYFSEKRVGIWATPYLKIQGFPLFDIHPGSMNTNVSLSQLIFSCVGKGLLAEVIAEGVLWSFTSRWTKIDLYEVPARLWPDVVHVIGSLSAVLSHTTFQCANICFVGGGNYLEC